MSFGIRLIRARSVREIRVNLFSPTSPDDPITR